nr:AT5g38990/K15E6_170 [Arabidopsis thaliana]AAN18200.1 At5g38990/K15E6_170 [Arabidopsis thaliana]
MICHVLVIFTILVSAVVDATASYEPTDVFLINCGDTSNNMDYSGRNWTTENPKFMSSNAVDDASFTSSASYQESGIPQVPYLKARIFRYDFTYSFPVSPGWKFLRLYFYPTRYGSDFDAVKSFFSVNVNRFTLLHNFSVKASIPESSSLIKEFIVPVNQTLDLTFTPSPNSLAFVNGIEIISMPDRFYSKGGFDDVVRNVGRDVDFEIDNSTAFETVYRVNVGGKVVGDVGDSGMFRRWLSDEGFLLGINSGAIPNITGVKINYTDKTPAYVAPEDVYTTCRLMGNKDSPELNLNFNLTWLFEVDAGFAYIVRLHFCETQPEVNKTGDRVFSIFFGYQLAMREMDVFRLSGGFRLPMYLDFKVLVDADGTSQRPSLRVDLTPYKEDYPTYYDAILSGVEILKLSNSDGNLAGLNPIPQLSPPPQSITPLKGKGKSSHVLPIIIAVVGSAVALAFFVLVVVLVVMKRKKKSNESSVDTTNKPSTNSSWGPLLHGTGSTNTKSASSLPSDLCRRFSIYEIKSATNDFEEKLIIGVGGFGSVYKGRIDGGATLVAVKRLEITSNQGAKEFDTELEMLSKLRHVHLVSLIGYCDDDNEMVLVYEYLPHGTLKDHLFRRDKASDPPLSWKRRLEICIGAARGLQYLHTGAKYTIIHRDIKTTNILLDENFVAKVSDFGLSRVGPTSASQTHVSTVVKGTFGYLDPEYYRRQILTEKSDVYSFGVVLLEVLCCRPIRMQSVPPEQADLIRWVKSNFNKRTVDQIIDSDLTADITSTSMEKFCEIAIRCVQDRGMERPPMNDVVWALEFALQLHETAKKKNDNVESLDLMPSGEVGTTTDGEDDLFSRTTGHVGKSTTTDDSVLVVGDERSGSSWGVFSEINEPKAR